MVLVTVAAIVTTLATFWWLRSGRYMYGRWTWQPEPMAPLPSMREPPVTGWRTGILDLGVPQPPAASAMPTVAASNVTGAPMPLIGSLGDRAYFFAMSHGGPDTQWWLVGIDTSNGHRLFDAISLNVDSRPPECLLNGPDQILCIFDTPQSTALVVDSGTGDILYRGPTDIETASVKLNLERLGPYAVATTPGRGIYGIGSRAETTWFIPGGGTPREPSSHRPDPKDPVLSWQPDTNPKVWHATVFSVTDGVVVHPEIESGATIAAPAMYPGGFAANVRRANGEDLGVMFFDDHGRRISQVAGRVRGGGSLLGLASIAFSGSDTVTLFSPTGGRLLTLPDRAMARVGRTLFLLESGTQTFPEWRQYDLKSGAKGPVCDFRMQHYVGTDGSTLVFDVTNPKAGILARGRDMATCKELWTLPAQPDSLQRIWRVDTNLIQLSADGTELSSLVPPG
ncbi:hypothetical protein L2K20_21755 [Mycobacterium sp. MBM]|nr:hypothetical protein [Mycobacterium sp. MBM]